MNYSGAATNLLNDNTLYSFVVAKKNDNTFFDQLISDGFQIDQVNMVGDTINQGNEDACTALHIASRKVS